MKGKHGYLATDRYQKTVSGRNHTMKYRATTKTPGWRYGNYVKKNPSYPAGHNCFESK